VILIDANIFMYAAGRESPQRLPCQRFLERLVAGGGPEACTDAEVLQEILRDCVHIGVMWEHEIEEVLSYDRGFSEISWLKRLEA